MAISASLVNTVPRDNVVRLVEYHIDNQLSDPDWIAENRKTDAAGRDYWSFDVPLRCITDIEIISLTGRYRDAGWDALGYQKHYRDLASFTLYKKPNT